MWQHVRGWLMSEETPKFGITKKVIGVILFVLAVALMSFALEARLSVLALIVGAIVVACLFWAKKLP